VQAVPRISYARSADGVSLAFTVAGAGPVLVFVPWVPFSNLRAEWQNPYLRAAFEELARRLTIVHYDGRGTGHSQRDVTDLSLDAMVADLEAVIDRLGVPDVCLLGQYNSCPHAIAYAARHPDRVTRMALFGGSGRGWNAMRARETQALLSLIEQDWDVFADTAAHQWMGWSAGEAGQAMADAIRGAVTPQLARATLQAASAVDVTEDLPAVAAPTLVLHRRDITQIPLDDSRALVRDLPRGRLAILEGARPTLFADDRDVVVTMLADFFCEGTEPADEEPARAKGTALPPDQRRDGLSRRELEVLRLIAAGESNRQIARRLGLSPHTIERHAANLYRKIGARGRADATAYALRGGLD
jgi:pimeloyl-ACP methyl ester carboxylesterase/DNA-binding CsgD family transcriptional regulator